MAGAELLVLDRDLDRPAELVGKLRDRGLDPVAVMAEQDDEMTGAALATEFSACASMLRPPRVCSTFGVSERIRVPAPAAKTTTAASPCWLVI